MPVILTQSRLFKNGLNTNLIKRSIIIVKYLSTSYVPGSELNAAGVRARRMYQSLSKKKKTPSHEKKSGRRKKKDRIVSMY